MDAGAHAVGGAELGHPDEHVDAHFLRPGHVLRREEIEDCAERHGQRRHVVRDQPFGGVDGKAGAVAVQNRGKNQNRGHRDQAGDDPLFQTIEYA